VKQITSYNVNDSSTVHASNVLVDDKFNVYVSLANNGTTNFNGIEGGLSNLNDVTNLCVLECDNNGKSNWLQSSTAESIAGGIDKYIYSTELFCNGHLYVCGAYNSSMIFGSTHLITNDPSQHTMYLAKLGNTPSSVTTRATMSQNTFAFYPNPAASQATIIYTLTKPGNVTLEIYDLLGRKVKYIPHGELSIGEHSEMLDLHELGNGTYLCRMISGGTVSSDVFTLVK
jgi:hypothetical protein